MKQYTKRDLKIKLKNDQVTIYSIENTPFTVVSKNDEPQVRLSYGNVWITKPKKTIEETIKELNEPTWDFYLVLDEAQAILREKARKEEELIKENYGKNQ